MERDAFEPFALWPIRVELPDRRGLTLWGHGGGDDDRVLAAAGQLLLFTSVSMLQDFVRQDGSCSFTGRKGYEELQHALRSDLARVRLDPVKTFALAEVGHWLSASSWDWDLARCASVLDVLNLLWDTARTLGDEGTRASLRGDTSVLGRLANALTFVQAHEVSEVLAGLGRTEIAQAFRDTLSRLELLILVDGGYS